MNKYEGRGFKCEGCRGSFYQLTENFRPTPPMRGDYVELLPKYGVNGHNWYDFPHTEFTIGDNVACVQCGHPIKIDYVVKELERTEKEQERIEHEMQKSNDSGSSGLEVSQGAVEETLPGGSLAGGGDDASGAAVCPRDSDNDGLYHAPDLEDPLLATVLRMTSEGATQTHIAETCGISVYRVRKFQDGNLG